MTRAVELLVRGHFHESLQMQPAALPVLAALVLLIGATVGSALDGSTIVVHRRPLGRVAIACALFAYTLMCAVWAVRAFGAFGGPVAVGVSPGGWDRGIGRPW